VQGGIGFAGNPPNPNIYDHGITTGASDSLDAMTLWVQTVRAPLMPIPDDTASLDNGRTVFENNCASCHGGPKWSKSQVVYKDNPAFTSNPAGTPPGGPIDPGVVNSGAQIISYTLEGFTLTFLEPVGTFDAANPIEIRSNGVTALGGLGFNPPALLGVGFHAPYFHDGSAQILDEVFSAHSLGDMPIAETLTPDDLEDLKLFLNSIDGRTVPFSSETDDFQDAVAG